MIRFHGDWWRIILIVLVIAGLATFYFVMLSKTLNNNEIQRQVVESCENICDPYNSKLIDDECYCKKSDLLWEKHD